MSAVQDSDASLQAATFFTNCYAELSPVISGRCLMLVYQLLWTGQQQEMPSLKDDNSMRMLSQAVQQWESRVASGSAEPLLALPLGEPHAYDD
jgi:hypothetical protein